MPNCLVDKNMSKIETSALTEAQATLLMPLWARAKENQHPQPILRDAKAEEIVEQLDFPFEQFEAKSVSALDYCVRASVFDKLVKKHLQQNPVSTVVELGVGLDTRSDRVDNGKALWVALDLPEVIRLRKVLLPDRPRQISLAHSLLDTEWIDEVKSVCQGNVIFTLEGVLYFFDDDQVRNLLKQLADHFPDSGVIFDTQSPLFLMVSNMRHPLSDSKLKFSLSSTRKLLNWDSRFEISQFVGFGDSPFFDLAMKRFSVLRRWGRFLFPPSRNLFKIIHLAW